ncbi:MAG: biotin/lipoyl-binding protein [Gammaproteobacteria bacterium]|nr:biotin/lipoyl-binding protein [Gammaproteobacteria bacterium]
MIRTLLIANRGEIACRVIRTARRLGIETVAVYSDADANAVHVRAADEAIRIGAAPAADSYLRIDAILEAVAATGAEAVHPGYGFLSENADFAEACAAAGCIFVGPSAHAIRSMGSKIQAKRLVSEAGTLVVPGYQGDDQGEETLRAQAGKIGYPLLVKASAGGGGKGMRLVESADGFDAALAGAKRESLAAFGDDQILLERYLIAPKHIEVQVLADSQGNTLYLFERDCSVQRRHQKIIEEAPGPSVTGELRRAIGEAAVRAARAIDYLGAGTVEFIAVGDEFYFMEMNTRLQVEHPVTEAIVGLDLVEWQLRIAAGEPITFAQEDLAISGHAIEARLYAENVKRNFLPSTGLLHRVVFPHTVRVDSGIETGSEVSVHYDPMIAKLIAHGADRPSAIAALSDALRRTEIVGVEHNVAYLRNVLANESFVAGTYTTGLTDEYAKDLVPDDDPLSLVVAALSLMLATDSRDPWSNADGFQLNLAREQHFRIRRGRKNVEVTVTHNPRSISVDGPDGHFDVSDAAMNGDHVSAVVGDSRIYAAVHRVGNDLFVVKDGATERFRLKVTAAGEFSSTADSSARITAPMPGQVTTVEVKVDDQVKAGQVLVVLEAMKMEHSICAIGAGKVTAVNFAPGDRVGEGVELVVIAP